MVTPGTQTSISYIYPRSGTATGTTPNDVVSTKKDRRGNTMTIRTCGDLDGSAVCSFKLNGVEYVDTADHGREMQSAVSFREVNGLIPTEQNNPTEAGSMCDGKNYNLSSSVKQAIRVTQPNGIIRTTTTMAYWHPRPADPTIIEPSNVSASVICKTDGTRKTVSNWVIDKALELVDGTFAPYLQYDVTMRSINPEPAHPIGQFEFFTIYSPLSMNSVFTTAETFDVTKKSISSLGTSKPYQPCDKGYGGGKSLCPNGGPPVTTSPIIYSNASGSVAQGIYSRDVMLAPNPLNQNQGFAGWFNTDGTYTHKMNVVRTFNNIPAGSTEPRYSSRISFVVGTLSQVRSQIQWLYDNGL